MLGQCCPQVQIKPWTEQECVIDAGGPQVYTSVFDDGTKRCRKKQKENLDAVDEASDGEPSLGTRPSQSSVYYSSRLLPAVHIPATAHYKSGPPESLSNSS